jgi:hypothetical protein
LSGLGEVVAPRRHGGHGMDGIDVLVEAAALAVEMEDRPLQWVVAGHGTATHDARLAVVAAQGRAVERRGWRPKAPEWSPEEEQFLRDNHEWMSDEEMAYALGRTRDGVHIRRERVLKLPPMSKHPNWLTPTRIAAELLGVDNHAVLRLVRRGLLAAERLPWRNQGKAPAWRVRRVTFMRWAVNPLNWIYFDPARVPDEHLRRLLELEAQRWGDEWWTPGDAAAWHGVQHTDINRFIHAGKIRGTKWGNWRILRSEATRPDLHIPKGRGTGFDRAWSEAGDAFMVLARAVGCSTNAIAGMMGGWSTGTVSYRLAWLRRAGLVEGLLERYGLRVAYRAETGELWADWREYEERFPGLARAMGKLLAGEDLRGAELHTARAVAACWARWFARTDEERGLARELECAACAKVGWVRAAWERVSGWGNLC